MMLVRMLAAGGAVGFLIVLLHQGGTTEGEKTANRAEPRAAADRNNESSSMEQDVRQATELRVPEGFEATVYATDALVHNAYCMTLDSHDRVVVSAPGYIRVLVDQDQNGDADAAITFADGPKSGAQGLCFDGNDLLAVGDGGLLRYRDVDADLHADGPPRLLLKLKTGGEHHAHAIRRGPNGWWYLICGNDTGIAAGDITSSNSPVAEPTAGTLLRFRFDETTGDVRELSVVADGMRNAYDFDFTAAGDAVTYDSDDEREVSLPWYRPTRVFRLTPGSHAGWFSRSWKRPAAYPEMPQVLASLGRGSPTGVAVCRGKSFPEAFRNAVFVGDWTFGRVIAVPLDDEEQPGKPIEVVRGVGTAGFAPTDLEFSSNGDLFVSAGGRGTTGTVYRIRYVGTEQAATEQRDLQPSTSSEDASRAAIDIKRLAAELKQGSPLVRRKALERLAEATTQLQATEAGRALLANGVASVLDDADANVRKAAMHVVSRLDQPLRAELLRRTSDDAGTVRFHLGRLRRNARLDLDGLRTAVAALERGDLAADVRYDAVRLAQVSLGDVGPSTRAPDTFSGYAARTELDFSSVVLAALRTRLLAAFPTGDETADEEFVRLVAMLRPHDPQNVSQLLERIDEASHPTDDLHHLFALARLPAARAAPQTQATAAALLAIDAKLAERGLPLDNNWGERLGDLTQALATADPTIVEAMLQMPAFGRPGHVVLLNRLSDDARSAAVTSFLRTAHATTDYAWTPAVIALLGESDASAARDQLRALADDPALRGDAIAALGRRPESADRSLFYRGLGEPGIDVVEKSLSALEELAPPHGPQEIAPLILAFQRLDRDPREYAVRSRIAKLLQKEIGEDFGFVFGKAGHRPQHEAVNRWMNYLREIAPEAIPTSSSDWDAVRELVSSATALKGDAERGQRFYEAKSCGRCHDGGAVGPDLAGVTGRFSYEDLFRAIADPDHNVSERYRGTLIQTKQGTLVTGLVVYESVDGITLKDGQTTSRVEGSDIEFRKPLETSLMPRGLLKEATAPDLADLAAYLKTIGR